MLNIRTLNKEDYDKYLVPWWVLWGFKPVPIDFLPDLATSGMIVFDNDIPIAAGFIYVTNSAICWIDWIVSNKEYRKKPERKNAIELLINSLTNVGRESGYKYAYALIKNSKLVDIYEKLGYTKGVVYTEEMILHL